MTVRTPSYPYMPAEEEVLSLFVTFYGDGPYWDNTILLAAYPSGILLFPAVSLSR